MSSTQRKGLAVPSWLEGRPFLVTFAILFGIVLLRAQATYWAGRGAATGAMHTPVGRRVSGPRVTRAINALNRWGLPVVTVSFLTIGFQTVVNAAAGLTRMRWGRYTAAMVPGCLAWALVYATVGFAALTGWMRLEGAAQWVALGLLVAVIAAGGAICVHVRRRRRARLAATERAVAEPSPSAAVPATLS